MRNLLNGNYSLSEKAGFVCLMIFIFITVTTCKKPERIVKLTTIEATNADITSTSALLKGEITDAGSGKIEDHGFLVSENSTPGSGNATVESLGGITTKGVFSATVTGLKKNTTYYFRAFVNQDGTDIYADKICQFTTKNTNLATVTAGTISNITLSSATLNGEVTSDGGEPVTQRGLCWGAASPSISSCIDTTVNGSGKGVFSGTITGLNVATQYYVRTYAINANGVVYSSADIAFTTHNIPSVTTIIISAITGTTATSGGNVTNDGGVALTAKGVCWSTTSLPTVLLTTKTNDGTTTGSFSSAITSLTPGTTYYVRAYATNQFGTGYGNELNFPTTVPPATTTAAATSVTTNGAVLNGSVNPNNYSTTVTFEYGTTTSYGTIINAIQSPVSGTNPVSVTAAPGALTPGTTYHYRVKAVNAGGTTEGNDVTFNTLKLPDAVTGNASAVTGTAATLNGTVNANNYSTTVTFEYGPTTAYGSEVPASQSPVSGSAVTSVSANISGLTQGATYHFRIKAINIAGTVYSSDQSFTASAAPTAVTNSATSVTVSTALLNGTVNANNSSTTVTFEYGTTTSYGSIITASQSPVSGTSSTSVTAALGGLTPGTTYHYKVKAVNAGGTTEGADVTFNTLKLPDAVTGIANAITGTVATLNGTVNANNYSTTVTFEYGTTISYGTSLIASQSPVSGSTVTSVSAGISSLSPETTYHFRIKAVSVAGTIYSSDQSFITLTLPTAVTNSATPVTVTTALLNGTVNANNSSATVTFEYGTTISYGTSVTASQSPVSGTSATPVSASLSGLTGSTTYHYKVKAVSAAGSAEGSDNTFTTNAAISVPTVTTTAISDMTTTTATGGGNVTADGGATVTSRGVCWSITANPTTSDPKTSDNSGSGIFSSALTGLTSGTTYHVRAYATNSAGTGYGSDVSFSTLGVPIVTTVAISATASTSAISGGTITSTGGTSVTAKGICWSTSPNPTTTDPQTLNGSGSGSFTGNLTGLSPNTAYYVRAYATNSTGTGYGNQVTLTTLSQVTDIEGNVYNTVTIGTQIWTQENLKTLHYRDGSPIPNDDNEWIGSGMKYVGNACWHSNNIINKDPYGALYNYYAVVDNRILCPTGWHIPTDTEWTTLVTYLGGGTLAGGKAKETGILHWNSPNTGATNESGFTVVAAGSRYGNTFYAIGQNTLFWSTTLNGTFEGLARQLKYNDAGIGRLSYSGLGGLSVRCLQGEGVVLPAVTTNTVTGITATTATCGGYVTSSGGGSITARGVCWNTSSYPDVTDSHTTDGTLTGGFSSNITGLTVATTYYLRAYATNSVGTVYGDEVSFQTVYAIGDYYQGGIIFSISGTYPNQHGLICAQADQSTSAVWGCDGSQIAGADGTAVGTGNQNTTDIVNGCPTAGIAAKICYDLNLNGYTDWYLPSIDELGLLDQHYRETLSSDFGGAYYYWSSTEDSGTPASFAMYKNFWTAETWAVSKTQPAHVRAVRTF
jgi:uncharacterized protein (TIGR02145 family)